MVAWETWSGEDAGVPWNSESLIAARWINLSNEVQSPQLAPPISAETLVNSPGGSLNPKYSRRPRVTMDEAGSVLIAYGIMPLSNPMWGASDVLFSKYDYSLSNNPPEDPA